MRLSPVADLHGAKLAPLANGDNGVAILGQPITNGDNGGESMGRPLANGDNGELPNEADCKGKDGTRHGNRSAVNRRSYPRYCLAGNGPARLL